MVRYFLTAADGSDAEGNQKLRLTLASYLEDGEFAKVLSDKVEQVVAPIFVASLQQAIAAGDAHSAMASPRDLFWFAHHTVCTLAAIQLPFQPVLDYPPADKVEREVCEYILRGVGFTDAAIAAHGGLNLPFEAFKSSVLEVAK